jgi:hypothetical protein
LRTDSKMVRKRTLRGHENVRSPKPNSWERDKHRGSRIARGKPRLATDAQRHGFQPALLNC